jgi:CRISPR-associated protein Cas2
MITFITYDITDPKRLVKTHKFLKEFGVNTQKSVFECDIDDKALKRIRKYCRDNLDLSSDAVRIYRICTPCMNRVSLSGIGLKITNIDYTVI